MNLQATPAYSADGVQPGLEGWIAKTTSGFQRWILINKPIQYTNDLNSPPDVLLIIWSVTSIN